MNDIITEFRTKYIIKRLAVNRPIDSQKPTVVYNNHIKNCKKMICEECSRLLKQ